MTRREGSVRRRRTRLAGALGAALVWSAAIAGGQAPPATTLSEALRAHLASERFQIVTSVRGLPLGVRNALQMLFASQTLDILEPDAEFPVDGLIGDPNSPNRRLAAAGCSQDHCLVYYERTGIAHTWQVGLFHWTPAATRFEWGGTAPGNLTTIDDVLKAVRSGAIKSPNDVW